MRNKWKKRSGEGYIDTCVLILCAMLVIALAVKVLPVYVAKQCRCYNDVRQEEKRIANRSGL